MDVLHIILQKPYQYFVLRYKDNQTLLIDEGISDSIANLSEQIKSTEQIIGIVPGEFVSIYEVKIPIRSRKQALQAIPYTLEDQIVAGINNVEFILLDWNSKGVSTVAIIDKQLWSNLKKEFEEQGAVLNSIIPDYALLPLAANDVACVFSEQSSKRILIRTNQNEVEKGFVLDFDELAYWAENFDGQGLDIICNNEETLRVLAEIPSLNAILRQTDVGETLSDLIISRPLSFNTEKLLLSGATQSGQTFERLKPLLIVTAGLIVLSIILFIASNTYEMLLLKKQSDELDNRIEQTFKETFPSVERIVDARLQFQRELDQLNGNSKGSQEFLYLLDQVLKAMPGNVGRITEMHYKTSSLDIVFIANNFQVLDQLNSRLEKQGNVKFERVSSDSQAGKVSAKYRFSLQQSQIGVDQ